MLWILHFLHQSKLDNLADMFWQAKLEITRFILTGGILLITPTSFWNSVLQVIWIDKNIYRYQTEKLLVTQIMISVVPNN